MDAQLNDQVTAMFRAAGFTDITRAVGDTFLTISGAQGMTRRCFTSPRPRLLAALVTGVPIGILRLSKLPSSPAIPICDRSSSTIPRWRKQWACRPKRSRSSVEQRPVASRREMSSSSRRRG